LHERTRPDAEIGMDIPRAGGAAFCRRQRSRTDVHAVGQGLAFAAVLLAILVGTVFAAVTMPR